MHDIGNINKVIITYSLIPTGYLFANIYYLLISHSMGDNSTDKIFLVFEYEVS